MKHTQQTSDNALRNFVTRIRTAWGPLSTTLVAECRAGLEELLRTATTEPWMAAIRRDRPNFMELHRDPDHGFALFAYVEREGTYREPHDHGLGWVVYGVCDGEVEMGTFGRVMSPDGRVQLVKRETYPVRPGDCRVYLPGDIHDTRCATEALKFRLTSCDFAREAKEGRMTRYVEDEGMWTTPAAPRPS